MGMPKSVGFYFETRFIVYAFYRVTAVLGQMSKGFFLSPYSLGLDGFQVKLEYDFCRFCCGLAKAKGGYDENRRKTGHKLLCRNLDDIVRERNGNFLRLI